MKRYSIVPINSGVLYFVLIGIMFACLIQSAGLIPMAYSATIIVTTADDELNSDGDCSLREAIRAANLDDAVDACAIGNGSSLPIGLNNK